MTLQFGGSGQTKQRKGLQYGGGWAKHAYGDLHPLSNRRERRLRNQGQLDGEQDRRCYSSREKRPTIRHLQQKLDSYQRSYDSWAIRRDEAKKRQAKTKPGFDCITIQWYEDILKGIAKKMEHLKADMVELETWKNHGRIKGFTSLEGKN